MLMHPQNYFGVSHPVGAIAVSVFPIFSLFPPHPAYLLNTQGKTHKHLLNIQGKAHKPPQPKTNKKYVCVSDFFGVFVLEYAEYI